MSKDQFPIFKKYPDLVYLDSAATSQKPQSVIDSITNFYTSQNANVHRGLYELSSAATINYEKVRSQVAEFINAPHANTIAFTKGTTESINIVAWGYLHGLLQAGDNVVVTMMEHHANFIPWQQVCLERGAELRVIPVDENGELMLEDLSSIIDAKTKMVALTHISNTLGTVNPISEVVALANKFSVPVLLDAAQSVAHYPIDVQKLSIDFIAFSAHKMFGPMGVGVLYANPKFQDAINPINFGGGAIKSVKVKDTKIAAYPTRLEAGTPNVAGVIGLGEAIQFIKNQNVYSAAAGLEGLAKLLAQRIRQETDFLVLGNPASRTGIVSFYHPSIHPHDIASHLGSNNIAVRAGHHCTQPLMEAMKVPSTVRASFSIYNDASDIHRLIDGLKEVKKFWS